MPSMLSDGKVPQEDHNIFSKSLTMVAQNAREHKNLDETLSKEPIQELDPKMRHILVTKPVEKIKKHTGTYYALG